MLKWYYKIIILGLTGLFFIVSNIYSEKKHLSIILYERNPWRMVIGSDSPVFALYDNKELIYLHLNDKGEGTYQKMVLSDEFIQTHIEKLLKHFGDFKNDYELSHWTDQPTQDLIIEYNGMKKEISIYGDLRSNKEVRNDAPKELLKLYDFLVNFSSPDASDWEPLYYEIMVWPFEYAKKVVDWPADLPDLHSGEIKKRGDSYSLYLPRKFSDDFFTFYSNLSSGTAVKMNNKKWAISYRIPFPHEFEKQK